MSGAERRPLARAADLTSLVVLAPATSARNVILPTAPSVVPLVIKAAAAQTANVQEWKDSAGTVLSAVQSDGNIVAQAGTANQAFVGVVGGVGAAIDLGNDGGTRLWRESALVLSTAANLKITTAGRGLILKSPDGLVTKKLTIDNAGALAIVVP